MTRIPSPASHRTCPASSGHLRFAGLPLAQQREQLENIMRADPAIMALLRALKRLDLPDWLLVSGAIYNNVWNHLTGRPSMTGVKDCDVLYFDDTDLSFEAEDRVIRRVEAQLGTFTPPVEVRNQARVHLWAPKKFGIELSPLASTVEALKNFACTTHAVGIRLDADDRMKVVAPFGLEAIFAFRLVPNYTLNNGATHERKARRALEIWPELTVEPWQERS
ncbi:MAG TPA: nucleotidyltransferase family protein [Devosia sp.]|nr:nucleotidyltransferase family protein [Devosia sp.]